MFKSCFDWIFQNKCLFCSGAVGSDAWICSDCFKRVTIINNAHCDICGRLLLEASRDERICSDCLIGSNVFSAGRSLFLYDQDKVQSLIMHFKKRDPYSISNVCAKLLVSKYSNFFKDVDVVIPVPSHWSRSLKRSYNPPSILAYAIFKNLRKNGNRVRFLETLKRTKKTSFQKDNKTIHGRKANVKDAFILKNCFKVSGKTVLLVDDVITTGATINECAKIVLKSGGAKEIKFATIASTPLRIL